MAFLDFMFGKKEKTQQFQRFTPQQQQTLNQINSNNQQQLPQAYDFLSQILSQDPQMMQRFEAPARRGFAEQTVPTIARRFGHLNAQSGSAFNQTLANAGKSLEESLAANRAQYGFNALSQLQGLTNTGLTPQFENVLRPRAPGFLENAALSAIPTIPQYFNQPRYF